MSKHLESTAETPPRMDRAASVLLLRDGPDGPEVLLTRRSRHAANWADNWVFPGGREDAQDAGTAAHRCLGSGYMDLDEPFRCALLTMVRETFEECGALLASAADTVAQRQASLALRQSRSAHFFDTLAALGLEVAATAIVPWSHWIPPAIVTRRYDTRFFLAHYAAAEDLQPDGTEIDALRWLSIEDAAAQASGGALNCAPPTIINLLELRQCAVGCRGAAAVLSRARQRAFITIEPQLRTLGGEIWALYPWDADFQAAPMQTTAVPDRYRELPSRLLLSTG